MLAHCLSNIPPTKTTPYMASMSPKHFAPVSSRTSSSWFKTIGRAMTRIVLMGWT
jgi:hypothetical protein